MTYERIEGDTINFHKLLKLHPNIKNKTAKLLFFEEALQCLFIIHWYKLLYSQMNSIYFKHLPDFPMPDCHNCCTRKGLLCSKRCRIRSKAACLSVSSFTRKNGNLSTKSRKMRKLKKTFWNDQPTT